MTLLSSIYNRSQDFIMGDDVFPLWLVYVLVPVGMGALVWFLNKAAKQND